MITSVILLVVGFGIPFGYFYLSKNPQFGGKLEKKEKKELSKSPQWKNGKFINASKTIMEMNLLSLPGFISERAKGKDTREPKNPIEIKRSQLKAAVKGEKPSFIWFGHSVLLMQMEGVTMLIDPMFGEDASPIGPWRTKRFSENSLQLIEDLPQLDIVLLTHDHYDHLDFKSIRLLKSKVDLFLVPLGVARHLIRWGVEKSMIVELDWWQEVRYFNIDFIFTPSRHFSGRGVADRAKSLWGGYVLRSENHTMYWSGDSGYDTHFKEIGAKLGPFDWGFIECGQYNQRWHQIHMYPEEAVKAALDAGVQQAIPVHWGAFSLALHSWTDPIERFAAEANKRGQKFMSPEPGEMVSLGEEKSSEWWKKYM
ncbi:MBL fold metallo-hydrolase [Lutimonas sp.]|uniref:MBL fold metallo-hydrolase n=1 Tax=Lutimonas sp. TaxID=1872403 RepID=UPI003D9B40F0